MQGGGNRERKREHLITALNGGVDCEAASVVENWPCCADKDTDATNCASAECLSGRSTLRGERAKADIILKLSKGGCVNLPTGRGERHKKILLTYLMIASNKNSCVWR